MAGLLKKIAKGALLGAGSILSLVNPAIGAPLIVAGSAIQTGTNTNDVVSDYAGNLNLAMNTAGAMQKAGAATTMLDRFLYFIQTNLLLVLAVIAGFLFLPKLLKRRR